jgi:outer membrane protein assembly factor BamB
LLAAIALTAPLIHAQDVGTQIYSNPLTPSREVLDRLNLQLGWRVYLPVQGRRDGIFTVQFEDKDLFVQTQAGLIVNLDPETGRERWRNHVGIPYRPTHQLGVNKLMVFAVNGTWLYALSRATGQKLWEYNLPNAPSGPPAADDKQVYLSLGTGHVYTYQIVNPQPGTDKIGTPAGPGLGQGVTLGKGSLGDPKSDRQGLVAERSYRAGNDVGPLSGGIAASMSAPEGPQPLLPVADRITQHYIEEAPLQTGDTLLYACANGGALALGKVRPIEFFYFPTRGPVTAAPGQHGETAYIGSHDNSLNALSIVTGKTQWRFTAPSPILKPPIVTDEDVYAAPDRSGLYRLDRASGEPLWVNPTADQFLGANKKFVYAVDRSGRLMVLDKKRGTTLSGFDTRDFQIPISNETTDRIYLGAHNGLLICLHDREYEKPLVTKYAEVKPPEKPGDKPPEQPGDKPPEKPPEKPMMDGDKPKPDK